ncbi:MAG: hypothetical protein N4A33_10980 [Bacteriovoracaceae bacterium]|jgi:hypothetical protein|nr:hypothetical protein [Bacteriovoracaceae bacterium]
MNKGIWLVTLLLSLNSFAISDKKIVGELLNKCKQLKGSYEVLREDPVRDGNKLIECAKVKCSLATKGADETTAQQVSSSDFSFEKRGAALVAWSPRKCITTTSASDDDFINSSNNQTGNNNNQNGNNNVNVSGDINGNGNTIGNGNVVINGDNNTIIGLCALNKCPSGYYIDVNGNIRGPNGEIIGTMGETDWHIYNGNQSGSCPGGCYLSAGGSSVAYNDWAKKCLKIKKFKWGQVKGQIKGVKIRRKCAKLGYGASLVNGKVVVSGGPSGHIGGTSSGCSGGKGGCSGNGSSNGTIVISDSDDDDLIVIDDGSGHTCNGGVSTNGSGRCGGSWVWKNNRKCPYTSSWRECLDHDYDVITSRHGDILHCINCEGRGRRGRADGGLGAWGRSAGGILQGVGSIFGAVAPGLFGWLSSKEYAGAMKYGYEQCRLMQENYVTQTYSYISNNELPDRDVTSPGCNGYGMGGFAGGLGLYGNGYGGFGNPYMGAGYTPGFMAGMYGPYGGMNPYGSINAGIPGLGGISGGFGMPGLGGGLNGGFTGLGGSWGGTPGINGGVGVPGFGWGSNPYGTGMGPNGNFGLQFGYGNGLVPWGNGNGSYWNGNGGMYGNGGLYGQGGMYGNTNWGAINQSYQSNAQAGAIGNYYQNAALAGQYQNAGNNYYNNMANSYYGYGPSYSPFNLGGGLNFNLGFGAGWN